MGRTERKAGGRGREGGDRGGRGQGNGDGQEEREADRGTGRGVVRREREGRGQERGREEGGDRGGGGGCKHAGRGTRGGAREGTGDVLATFYAQTLPHLPTLAHTCPHLCFIRGALRRDPASTTHGGEPALRCTTAWRHAVGAAV